jgi:high affinity sulfate transporter 1
VAVCAADAGMTDSASRSTGKGSLLERVAPGLAKLLHYNRADFPHDLIAGLSVAAVALPVGVAYAQLAGFNPAVGLYASMLPLVAYAIFGTSRQLIVGPDAATCALVASSVAPIAAGNQQLYLSLSITLTLIAGLLCIVARFFRLGALADFLSKPILVGFLNGVALSIILGQIGKIFGFSINAGRIVPRLLEFLSKVGQTHLLTLTVGLATFAIVLVLPKFLRKVPAALVAMIVVAAATKLLGLDLNGVKTVGAVPAGLPWIGLALPPVEHLQELFGDACGLALVTFSSMMLTSRSFASKNRYDIDADREFAALGAANIAAAISQSFAISGAASRTAVSDASGGRTQVTGLVTAATVAIVLIFFTGPLQYVPIAALGAILVMAAISLIDIGTLKLLFKIDKQEFAISILATLGVVAVGAIHAILIAVILAILRFIKLMSRPKVEVLGSVEGMPGLHFVGRHSVAKTYPGICLFRFNAPIVFFNAPYFKREALAAASTDGATLKWFVMDMIPVSMVDSTGLFTVKDVVSTLHEAGVRFVVAGRQTEWKEWREKRGLEFNQGEILMFPTLRAAIKAFRKLEGNEVTSEPGP